MPHESSPPPTQDHTRIAARFPDGIGGWTPVPLALYEVGHLLGLNGHDKAVVAALAIHYRKAGADVYPSIELLAERTEFSISTVRRSLKKLEAARLVPRTRSKDRRGQMQTHRYDLRPLWQALADQRPTRAVDQRSERTVASALTERRPALSGSGETEAVEVETSETDPPKPPRKRGGSRRERRYESDWGRAATNYDAAISG